MSRKNDERRKRRKIVYGGSKPKNEDLDKTVSIIIPHTELLRDKREIEEENVNKLPERIFLNLNLKTGNVNNVWEISLNKNL